jgi:hypothetical protein
MLDFYETYRFEDGPMATYPITKPNIRTGEGRSRCRPLSRHRVGDMKKKTHRMLAKKSRRINRR